MSTTLWDAVSAGDLPAVHALLSANGDANLRDEQGATPLMLAASLGNPGIVQALIDARAEVNAADARGWTPLVYAVYNAELDCGFPDVVSLLIGAGANIEAPIGYGVRPLMLAAGYGQTRVVEVLLQHGADVFARNDGGYTALMMVKQKHYVDVVNLLHEAELLSGAGGCESRNAPGSGVITFMKRP